MVEVSAKSYGSRGGSGLLVLTIQMLTSNDLVLFKIIHRWPYMWYLKLLLMKLKIVKTFKEFLEKKDVKCIFLFT